MEEKSKTRYFIKWLVDKSAFNMVYKLEPDGKLYYLTFANLWFYSETYDYWKNPQSIQKFITADTTEEVDEAFVEKVIQIRKQEHLTTH